MKLCGGLCVVAVWLVLCVVQENVVLGDEGSSRVETTFVPDESLDTESTETSYSSSADEERTTIVVDLASHQSMLDNFKGHSYKSKRERIIEEIKNKIERRNPSFYDLEPQIMHLIKDFQIEPDFYLPNMHEEVILIRSHKPPTLEMKEDDVAPFSFVIGHKLRNRRIKKARLWVNIDSPHVERTLDFLLYEHTSQATDDSDTMDVQIDLLQNKTVEQPASSSLWVPFNVKKVLQQRARGHDVTFLVRSLGTKASKLIGRWKSLSDNTDEPFIPVYIFTRESEFSTYAYRPFLEVVVDRRTSSRIKRDDEPWCGYTNYGDKDNECCRYPFSVNLHESTDFDWITGPQSYDMGECKGSCPMDTSSPENELYALEKSMMQCVPTVVSSEPIHYYDPLDESKSQKAFFGPVVEECDCVY